jgi:hypothetical protein
MHSYEIQTFKDGEWKVGSIFDDREEAIDEARRIEQSTRYAGVKVIQEIWDEENNTSTFRTLFRGGAAKNDLPEKSKTAAASNNSSRHYAEKRTERPRRKKHQAKKAGFVVPIIVLMAISLAAGAALIGLQQLSGLR